MLRLRSVVLLLLALLVAASAMVAAPTMAQGSTAPLISLAKNDTFGNILVGKDGMTLYIFTVDPLNTSNCNDQCAKAWPPLTVTSADQVTAADGIPGKFATITRKDNTMQVTYNGMPLYYWFKDKKAGDTTGNRVTRNWWVVPPATVYGQELDKVGNVLVGPTGMTLYMFSKDTANTSTCTGDCAKAWPPLTVKSADQLVPGLNLLGKFDTTKRDDGSLQVTYNGMPLYYFAKDQKVGDATGEGVGKVWFTVGPEVLGVANSKDLGDYLTTADGMTLYTYSKDSAGTSTCTGDCLKAWPAAWVYANDKLTASSTVKGKIDVIKGDTTSQLTYNGMPLYVFAKDTKPGDTTGDKVGGVWNIAKP